MIIILDMTLSPGRYQAIFWPNVAVLAVGPLEENAV